MPRIGVGLLILLVAVGLPGRGMAKSTASIPRRTQMFSEFDNVCADEQELWLTAGELFTIDILPETCFFDSPPKSYITVECISIAEILDDTSGQSCAAIEPDPGEFEEVSFAPLVLRPDVSGLRKIVSVLGIMDLFVMASPYEFMIGHYEMPLPELGTWLMTFGL